ncbi:MAG: single-stranded DNA-binding protein [Candidatus Pacebacteria bacterium]|nr:single-stranded DNA-binding protein [Candidatus Paceibacterota bacterium]
MFLNKAIIFGNLTRDPERRSLPSGQAVVSMGVATNRIYFDQNKQKHEDTEFHNVVIFGRQAEVAAQYLKKGSSVLIEGRIKTRNWQDQQGQKHYKTEIIAERMQLGPRTSSNYPQNPPQQRSEYEPSSDSQEIPIIEEETSNSPGLAVDDSLIDDNNEIDVKDIPF